ncbi:MAG: addiction module protein [Planctomycetes bacterium]|nr:addiction module protein [Planctomycetota bacterium]
MSDLKKVATEALALSPDLRAQLAEILIQSLEEPEETEVKSKWLEEIYRRDQEIRSGKVVCKPADQVLREAREHLRCKK